MAEQGEYHICGGPGKLSKAATVELMDFSRHLREHPKDTIADGCRFCADRAAKEKADA